MKRGNNDLAKNSFLAHFSQRSAAVVEANRLASGFSKPATADQPLTKANVTLGNLKELNSDGAALGLISFQEIVSNASTLLML